MKGGHVAGESVIDVLMTPISPLELAMAYTLGGIVRGLVVGAVTAGTIALFLPIRIHDVGAVLLFGTLATMMLSLLGIMGAIWADKFDHIAAVTNFIVTPLTFLGGSFYSISMLPPAWRQITLFNPVVYLVSGFRWSFYGISDVSIAVSLGMTLFFMMVCLAAVWGIFRTGYRLKS